MKTHKPTATQSAFIDPDPSPLAPAVPETCDIPGQSETSTDATPPKPRTPLPSRTVPVRISRTQPTAPGPAARVTPETHGICVESETSAASRAHRPASDFQLLTSNSQLLPSTSPPRRTCDNTGQCETSAASRAHRPASDLQLLTPNSQLLASTPPPRRTCDNTGQSETFAAPSRAVLCPETQRETPTPNKRPCRRRPAGRSQARSLRCRAATLAAGMATTGPGGCLGTCHGIGGAPFSHLGRVSDIIPPHERKG